MSRWQAALLAGPTAFLVIWFAAPLASTFDAASLAAWQWSLGPYVQSNLRLAAWQALLSTIFTLSLAIPLAWFYHARNVPAGRVQLAVHAAPFVLPVFVIVFGIQAVFGEHGWTATAFGFSPIATFGPLGAVVIAHAYYNYGFAARLIHAALERRPHRLEEAAQVLGAQPLAAFSRTTLRLLGPTIASVALLVFLFCFTSFGVVLYMGEGTVQTLETLLYQNLRGAFPRPERAAMLAVIQLALNAALLFGYMALRRTTRLQRQNRVVPAATTRRRIASWVLLVVALTPAVAVLRGAFQVRGTWSLEPWRALIQADHPAHMQGFDLFDAIGLSLMYAAASTLIALGLTLLLGYGVQPLGRWPRRIVEAAAALPLGTSSLLIGLGFLFRFGISGFLDVWTGRALIVIAHTLIAFPFTSRALLPAMDQHDTRLDEAAKTLGASPIAVLLRIHWPAMRAPAIAAAGLAIAMSLGDFGASLLLMNAENRGISVWIDRHGGVAAFDPLVRAQADALAAILMVMAGLAALVVERARGMDWS